MSKAHEQLNEDLYGRLVKIQLFKRVPNDADALIHDSLQTYFGKLVGFSTSKRGVVIYLEALGSITVSDKYHYVEVFDKGRPDRRVIVQNNYSGSKES
jgi:hypothetical protein